MATYPLNGDYFILHIRVKRTFCVDHDLSVENQPVIGWYLSAARPTHQQWRVVAQPQLAVDRRDPQFYTIQNVESAESPEGCGYLRVIGGEAVHSTVPQLWQLIPASTEYGRARFRIKPVARDGDVSLSIPAANSSRLDAHLKLMESEKDTDNQLWSFVESSTIDEFSQTYGFETDILNENK